MYKKFVVAFLVIVLAALAVVPAMAQDPIKIGVVDSFTGSHSAYGLVSLDGYNLAKKYRPEVLGRPIEFIIVDIKSDKAETAVAAARAIADGAVALLGTASSGFTIAMNEVAAEKGIPTVTNFSTNPLVTQDNDISVRTCFTDPYQGWALARFAYNDLGARTAVVLVDLSADYNVGVANFFKTNWKEISGNDVLETFSLMMGDTDFSAQLTAIKNLNPDVVVIPNDYKEVGLILKQARELGLEMPFLASDAADFPEVEQIAGDAIDNNFYLTTVWHPDAFTNKDAVEFGDYWRKEYNREPDATAAVSWDAYNVLVDAIERAGTDDPELIRQELFKTKDFQGVSGTITIDAEGDALKSVPVIGYKDGKKVFIRLIELDE